MSDQKIKFWWLKAQGNQLDKAPVCSLDCDDDIDVTEPGEDRWIATIIQSVDPEPNPISKKAKWIKIVQKADYDALADRLAECEAALQVFADDYCFVATEYFEKWSKK